MATDQLKNEELAFAAQCEQQATNDQRILDETELEGNESYLDHVERRRNWAEYLARNARERAEYYS